MDMNKAQVTSGQNFLTDSGMGANAAQRLLSSGMNINSLRTNRLLRYDEWKELDEAIVSVARERLVVVDNLINQGLDRQLGGLGTIIDQYERQGDMTDATVDMDAATPSEEDLADYDIVGVPVPIHHKGFRVDIRKLEASRNLGDPIDTTAAEIAARKVAESLEDMVFNGISLSIGSNTIYGLTNHPDRNTGTLSDWSADIDSIYEDINDMIEAAENDSYYGPYALYIAGNRAKHLREIHDDGSGQSVLYRIQNNLDQIQSINVADRLADDTAVMYQTTSDVIDLPIAEDITNIEWATMGGLVTHMKVMACMTVRVKSDKSGQCGIVHFEE